MTDLVQILDAQTGQPLFAEAHTMGVTVRETSTLTSWPVEDGTQRTDHRVLRPDEIDLQVIITQDNKNLFNQLRRAYLEGDSLLIQTQMRTYESMMIYEFPHDEKPEMGDAIAVTIKLRQVIVIKPEYGTLPPAQVANPAQSSTVKRGGQQTTESSEATKKKASVLYGVFN